MIWSLKGVSAFSCCITLVPQTCHHAHWSSHRICRSGVQAGLNSVVLSHSRKARIKIPAGLCSPLQLGFFFQAHVAVGRIQFLVFVEPRPSIPRDHCHSLPCSPLISVTIRSSKANGRAYIVASHLSPLDSCFKGSPD